jgi:hypothetical protein
MVVALALGVGGLYLVYMLLTQTGLGRLTDSAADALDGIINPEDGSYWDIGGNLATILAGVDDDPFNVPLTEEEIALLAQLETEADAHLSTDRGAGVGVNQSGDIWHKNLWRPGFLVPVNGPGGAVHPVSEWLRDGWNNRHTFPERNTNGTWETMGDALANAFGKIDLYITHDSAYWKRNYAQQREQGYRRPATNTSQSKSQHDATNSAYGFKSMSRAIPFLTGTGHRQDTRFDALGGGTTQIAQMHPTKWGPQSWRMNQFQTGLWNDWLTKFYRQEVIGDFNTNLRTTLWRTQ